MPPNKKNKPRDINLVAQEPGAAQTPPVTPPPPQIAGTRPYDQSTEKATLNAIEKLWIIGPWLIVIYRAWSLHGLVLFLFGLLVGALLITGLFFSSAVPVEMLPEKYRGQQTAKVPEEKRSTPHGDLAITEVKEEDNPEWKSWLNDYRLLCRQERLRFEQENARATVEKLVGSFSTPTTEFSWRLSVDPSHRIVWVRGFRITSSGLIYAITYAVDENESTATFKTPACERGDTLVAIAVTVSRTPNDDKQPVFQSSAP